MTVSLRPYQEAMVDRIRASFARHRRVIGVAPTGSGKTVLFSYICRNAALKGKRVTLVAHRTEIVDQISQSLDRFGVRHGRIGRGHYMTDDPVQVAMVQTLGRRLNQITPPDLLIIDEAHHGVAGSWKAITETWNGARILGVTATPERLDGKGLADCFDDMVIGPTVSELIEARYLAKFVHYRPPPKVDLDAVKIRLGDYAVDQLAAAMNKPVITGDAVEHFRQRLAGRPAIAFCVTIEHAEAVARQFCEAGFRGASVDGTMGAMERASRMAAIGDGRLNVLTSCDLISEGVDIPVVAGAILLRPTKSLAMYLQQVGRALRPKPDGSDAVILDHVGNGVEHGRVDADRAWSLTETRPKGSPPTVTCEVCYQMFAVRPGWKMDAECGESDPDCALLANPEDVPVGRDAPKVVDGILTELTETPLWSDGLNIRTAKGVDFQELLGLADTADKLQAISKVRGYKRGWVKWVIKGRNGRNG